MTAAVSPSLPVQALAGPRRPWRLSVALLAAVLSAAGLWPAAARAVPEGTAAEGEARAWLWRMQHAQLSGNFRGTLVYSAEGVLTTSRVAHFAVGDQSYEQLETMDGRHQHIVRHNDAVHTLMPSSRTAIVEKRELLAAWSATPQLVDPKALENYELRREGRARVAGRDAVVLLMQPRDALRFAQRLWADLASGLMLRADVLGAPPDPVTLESTSFTEVEIGVRPRPEALLRPIRQIEGWKIVRPQQRRTELADEGWALAQPVAGFRLVGCVRRGMEYAGDGETSVLQAVFTDGLTHVSLFVEPLQPQRHAQPIMARQGATGTVMKQRGEYWITAVGNVPAETLHLFTEALQRQR